MIKRTMLRMQGKGRGTLALEVGETLQYQLSSTIPAVDAKLVLFFDTQNYKVVEGNVGELEALPAVVQAAAVVQNNTFLLTGAYEQFDWSAAKQTFLYPDHSLVKTGKDALQNEPSVGQILEAIPMQENPASKEMATETLTAESMEKQKVMHPFTPAKKSAPVVQEQKMPQIEDITQLETSAILKQAVPGVKPEARSTPEAPVVDNKYIHSALPRDITDTDACIVPEETAIKPFSYILPLTKWKKVTYPYNLGAGYYLSGKIYEEQVAVATAIAVPGSYAINPPPWLEGFQTYLEDEQTGQGYWLFFRDIQTGEPTTLQNITKKSQ